MGEALTKLPRQGVPMERNEIGKGFSCSPRFGTHPMSKSTGAINERFGTGVPIISSLKSPHIGGGLLC